MAESFSRWESDPLFSAAEVVQDSADRMDYVYRTLLHEQSLEQEDPSDPKLLSSLQYHKRDLTTALETTRWQLEDFEREVNLAALSDESKSREIAILKHRQFIRAIREQILEVEKSVQGLIKDDNRGNSQWMNLNEQDKDMLTSFLSGANFGDQSSNYDTGSRSFDSNTENDEIVEIKSEEVEALPMNGNAHNFNRKNMPWKIGSHFDKQHDLELGGFSAKNYYPNKIKGSAWGYLRNFWLGNTNKGSFTKMRKDGEIVENAEQSTASQKGASFECVINAMQLHKFITVNQRKFSSVKYAISYNRRMRLMLVLLIMLIIGFIVFRMI